MVQKYIAMCSGMSDAPNGTPRTNICKGDAIHALDDPKHVGEKQPWLLMSVVGRGVMVVIHHGRAI